MKAYSHRKAISMTDCTTKPLLFSSLRSQKIQADFNSDSLTSDAGALLLFSLLPFLEKD
jgi:hypothetical protein